MFIALGVVAVLFFVAFVISPPMPKSTMTKAEVNKGCTMSLWSLVLIAMAGAIVFGILWPIMAVAP